MVLEVKLDVKKLSQGCKKQVKKVSLFLPSLLQVELEIL